MELNDTFQSTEYGDIPLDWICLAVGDVTNVLTGFPFPSTGYSTSGIRLLRGSNVKRNETDWSDEITQYWPNTDANLLEYVLSNGDIVVSMDGSLVGKSFAVLSAHDVPALLLQRVARLRATKIDQKYLATWICSSFFSDYCDSVKTVTAIPHISPGDIKSYKIALPPTKAEQEAIAEALSDADTFIESLEQLIAKKRQIKQGAMQELLAGKRRLPGFKGEWTRIQLGKVVEIKKGQLITETTLEHGFVPVIAGGKKPAYHHARANRKSNTITISGSGANAGYVAYHNCPIFASDCCTIEESTSYSVKYIYYCLLNNQAQIYAAQTGGAQPHIHPKDLAPIFIDLPVELNEQRAIDQLITEMDYAVATLEEKLRKASFCRVAMMQELLTGRIRLI